MADQEEDDPSFYEVVEEDYIELKLVLPNGTVLDNFPIKQDTLTLVQEEKARIMLELNQVQPPNDFVLKLLLPGGEEIVMDDQQCMALYKTHFVSATIKIEDRRIAQNRQGGHSHPGDFGYSLK